MAQNRTSAIMPQAMPPVPKSPSRLASLRHALRGLARLLATQPNARIHVLLACVATALGVWLGLSPTEWAVLALTVGLVLAAEALNTALELAVDLASPQWHALARDAKDVAAAGVLLASLAALAVGGFLFIPKLLTGN